MVFGQNLFILYHGYTDLVADTCGLRIHDFRIRVTPFDKHVRKYICCNLEYFVALMWSEK